MTPGKPRASLDGKPAPWRALMPHAPDPLLERVQSVGRQVEIECDQRVAVALTPQQATLHGIGDEDPLPGGRGLTGPRSGAPPRLRAWAA
jgi:hypothetical protein